MTRPDPPTSIRALRPLEYARTALALVTAVVVAVSVTAVPRNAVVQVTFGGDGGAQVRELSSGTDAVGGTLPAGLLAIVAVLWWVFLRQVRAGEAWAAVVVLVLVLLQVVGVVALVLATAPATAVLVLLLGVAVLDVVALVLLALPRSRAWLLRAS